jgi:hypothetical protein
VTVALKAIPQQDFQKKKKKKLQKWQHHWAQGEYLESDPSVSCEYTDMLAIK